MPGPAAVEALRIAQEMFPKAACQALIDRMVITGLSALVHREWRAPLLYGHRDRWRLPENLRDSAGKQSKEIKGSGT